MKKQNTKLVPIFDRTMVKVEGSDEIESQVHITYYEGNQPQACKSCLAKKDKDLTYIMKLRRPGSAYCQECSKEYSSVQ